MLTGILVFLFCAVCVFLCLIILIQEGQGGGLSGAFGGGGGESFFGPTVGKAIVKFTIGVAAVFLVLSIILNQRISSDTGGVLPDAPEAAPEAPPEDAGPANDSGSPEAPADDNAGE
jgi:preprotein translocase subunit SecG